MDPEPTLPVNTPVMPSAPAPVPVPAPRNYMPIIVAVLGTALLVSGLFFGISFVTKPKETAVVPAATPTPNATPTPIRQPSAIAGQATFIDFQSAVSTLSAAIAGYNSQDPSLTPPTLVLPLGFTQH